MKTMPKHNARIRVAVGITFGSEGVKALDEDKCPKCKNPVGPFRDEISEREYNLSALCQSCQDTTFVDEE